MKFYSQGKIEYNGRHFIDKEQLEEWDSLTIEQRAEILNYRVYDDMCDDAHTMNNGFDDRISAAVRNVEFYGQGGKLFSYEQVAEMTSSELILRGILNGE